MFFRHVIYIVFTLNTLSGINTAHAQSLQSQNVPGEMEYGHPGHPWADMFRPFINGRAAHRKYDEVLCSGAAEICAVVAQASAVNPPQGFNTNPFASGPVTVLPFPVPVQGLVVTFCNYPLYVDKQTRQVKQSGTWGSSVRLYVNDPEMLFNYSYRLADDCDSAGVPVFCFEPAMHRDQSGFWVSEDVRGLQRLRVIKKKGVPLYTPVTQKEFLEFEIKFEQKNLVHGRQQLAYNKKMVEKYPQNRILKQDVNLVEDKVVNTIKAIRDYQKSLNAMSAKQLQQPAYTSAYGKSPKGHYYFDLVPPAFKGATRMVRLNPRYFDASLPAGTVQLVLVGAAYSPRSASPDIIRKVNAWFDGIDYQKLQEMIR